MKAVFLGAFAASQAATVAAKLTSPLDTETVADPADMQRLAGALDAADIVVSNLWRAEFPPAPHLKLLQSVSAGLDLVDVAALPAGVTVCNVFGHEPAIAEYVMMTMLVMTHRLFEISESFRGGSWAASGVQAGPPHGELLGRTIGLVGLGRVGREIARRAAAFGCHVLAANRSPAAPGGGVEQVFALAELDRMLPLCDIVVLCCALAPETQGLIDAGRLGLMKPSALLVNIARGPVADEDALYAALRDRRIGGAALDVWWRYPTAEEPMQRPSRHPFHELPNVIMTPHCSGWTEGMADRRWGDVARNLDRFARGEPLDNVVLTR